MSKLWGGCFTESTSSSLTELNCSLPVDSRLFADDIDGSKAYAEALAKAGIITVAESDSIIKGLELVRYEWIEGIIKFLDSDEDVHTVNERRLTELIGSAGQKLHTGRSRNDQVVTDMKLWMRKGIRETLESIGKVISAGIQLAEKHIEVIMPGYTHLQRAQAVLFSHWVLSHITSLKEDSKRFVDLKKRANILPLGSGAIAGNPLNIDREFLAKKLNFDGITQNSMHAVGDRDFVVDFIYCAAMASTHLSRLAEDLILFATKEFNFVKISDKFSTGSSLMPQKRNPDSLELVRGITGILFGNLSGVMMTIKGTPSTYNKDLQYDKKFLFDSFDQLKKVLDITCGVLRTLTINATVMENALSPDMLATDWAYYLVRKGVPFRTAHHHIGQVVAFGEKNKMNITEIPLKDLKSICDKFDKDVLSDASDFRKNIKEYKAIGGTSPSSVKDQIDSLKEFLKMILK